MEVLVHRTVPRILLPIFYVLGLACLISSIVIGRWWTFTIKGEATIDGNSDDKTKYTIHAYKGLFRSCAGAVLTKEGMSTTTFDQRCDKFDFSFDIGKEETSGRYFTVARISSILSVVFAVIPSAFLPCVIAKRLVNKSIGQVAPFLIGGLLQIAVGLGATVAVLFGLFVRDIFDGGNDLSNGALQQVIGNIRGHKVDLEFGSNPVKSDSPYFGYILACAACFFLFFAAMFALLVTRRINTGRAGATIMTTPPAVGQNVAVIPAG